MKQSGAVFLVGGSLGTRVKHRVPVLSSVFGLYAWTTDH